MAVDLQDFVRRLFKAAETDWTNTGLRPDQHPDELWNRPALPTLEG